MEYELNTFNHFKIYQPKKGYRFSSEPFILVNNLHSKKAVFLDFGSGSGIISILLALKNPNSKILAVEKNTEMKKLIHKNLKLNNINNVKIMNIEEIKPNSVDFFISNPPYFKQDSYRVSKKFKNEKFEDESLDYIIALAKRVLKNKGKLRLSYHPTRLAELIVSLNKNGFGVKSIKPIYGKKSSKAVFTVVEAMLSGKNHIEIEEPLVLSKDMDWSTI